MGLCHEVTVLTRDGRSSAGTPEEVRANPAVLDAYLGGGDDDDLERRAADAARARRPETASRAARGQTSPPLLASTA